MAQLLNIEAFIWATGAFCQLNRIPHDAALLIKQCPPPYDIVHLQQALNHFGLNNSLKRYSLNQLPHATLPCLAILKSISQQPSAQHLTDSPAADAKATDAPQPSTTEPSPTATFPDTSSPLTCSPFAIPIKS